MSLVEANAEVTKTQIVISEQTSNTKRRCKICGYEVKRPEYFYTGIGFCIGSTICCFFCHIPCCLVMGTGAAITSCVACAASTRESAPKEQKMYRFHNKLES
ncbi:hypothetical protein [Parashewanella tropica]|uniref:hypothetical protein n=1 Tax=Parashewanella tropica TaxID=2547970 RepID=UPI001059E661|nr:hypothetical protein [Parashewanella tropica]